MAPTSPHALVGQNGRDRFGVALLGCAGLMLGAAVLLANASGQTATTLLGPAAGFVDWIAGIGQQLTAFGGVARQLGIPLGVALLAAAAWWLSRGRPDSPIPIVVAVAFAALGQLFALGRSPWVAALAYGLAIGIYASRRSDSDEAPSSAFGALASVPTLVCVIAALGLFLLLGIHLLDVFPAFYFDEGAYLNAARMQVGTLEPGVVARYGAETVYDFERLRFQRIPLWMQSAALLLLEPGLLSIRLVSLAAMFAALALAAVGLRGRIGSVPIAGMVALAAASPLALGYGRMGQYMSVTVLHGVLCLLALLRLEQRWNTRSALLLGVLLGASLYLYQLSWFVPVFALLALGSTPQLWRRPQTATRCAIVAGTALLVMLPGLIGMQEGLRSVAAQTFDKAAWNPTGGVPLAVVVAPAELGVSGADEFAAAHRSEDLTATRSSTGDRPVVVFYGEKAEVDRALHDARAAGWHDLGGEVTRSAISRATDLAKRLFYLPGWESGGRWIDGSLLNAWVAPLLILGLVEALRRRSVFVFRLLGLWVVAGALLPASIGGGFPRRTVLMLPVVHALAMLPLAEWVRSAVTTRSRALAVSGSVLWVLAAAAVGTHQYLHQWDQVISLGPSYSVLKLDKALNGLPAEERVLAPKVFGRNWKYLHPRNTWRAQRVALIQHTEQFDVVRRRSCNEPVPFTWAVPDAVEILSRFSRLSEDFAVREQRVGPYVLIRVQSLRPGGCAGASGNASD